MLFNSIEFAIFLPIVFSVYWLIGSKHRFSQNLFVLFVSYVFYGWWDWRFLSLLIISSVVDFSIGILLSETKQKTNRNMLLAASLVVNLGFLGFFKYFNFFIESFAEAFTFLGTEFNVNTLNIILPVGISFYTFQTLSYTIDVYREKIEPTKDIVAFFAFVAFFPQLVAGPIERASNLLPQFQKTRFFDYEVAKDGSRQILWGLFKKVVIADTAAILANDIFKNYDTYSSSVLVLGAFYFSFQIYGDFSGYSDIAIGTSKLFGFRIMRNFAYPYFSRDMAEFWRRWHISLSTWFRDYLYIPLGGSNENISKVLRNVVIIFAVSGFWHGANWTFIVWGILNAIYFIPLLLTRTNRKHMTETASDSFFPSGKEALQILLTFNLTMFAWIFFRAENVAHAFDYITRIFSFELFPIALPKYRYVPLILIFIIWEWVQRDKYHGLEINNLPLPMRWGLYFVVTWMILFFIGEEQEFIYFQF